jgi:hypothetical protein
MQYFVQGSEEEERQSRQAPEETSRKRTFPAVSKTLKVPKCEIFDRSDFPDFYTIKSSWVGDLVVKILTYYFLLFEGAKPHLFSDAHAKHTRKELMRMLSMCISS